MFDDDLLPSLFLSINFYHLFLTLNI
jgi:hypothetical protein